MNSKLLIFMCVLLVCHGVLKPPAILVVGRTGDGKSTFINFVCKDNVAKEGYTYDSETSLITSYCTDHLQPQRTCFLDTPGFEDTRGIANELLLESTLKELHALAVDGLSAVIVIVDGTSERLYLLPILKHLQVSFGEEILDSVVLGVNFAEKMSTERKANFTRDALAQLANLPITVDKIVFLDAKSSLDLYAPALTSALAKATPYSLKDGVQRVQDTINNYYQEEISDPNNYIERKEKIAKSAPVTRTITKYKKESYTEECNCRRVCAKKILGICIRHTHTCDQCARTREVPVTLEVTEIETTYEEVTKREALYENAALKRKAEDRYKKEVNARMFDATATRNSKL